MFHTVWQLKHFFTVAVIYNTASTPGCHRIQDAVNIAKGRHWMSDQICSVLVGYNKFLVTIEDFHARTKKSEIYSVGKLDLKFDAKQALGSDARRTHESIWFLLYTQYILRHFVN